MPIERSHDRPYPGAPRADELPEGVPAQAEPPSRGDFDKRGKFARGNAIARKGGKALAGKSRLASRLTLADGTDLGPYRRAAVSFRRAQCAALAASVGGGYCGPGPSSMVASAALQLMWARYFSDQAAVTGDAEMALKASKLSDASRNNLLSAHELCAHEARPARRPSAATIATCSPPSSRSHELARPLRGLRRSACVARRAPAHRMVARRHRRMARPLRGRRAA